MKNYKFYLPLLLFMLMFFSCDDDSVFVNLDQSSFIIDAKGGSETVKVTASGDWSVTDIPEWIFLNSTSGRHDSDITIQVREYKEQDSREATLVFACGKETQALQIQQLGLKDSDTFLELEQEEAKIHVDGGSFTLQLTANRKWEIKNTPDWMTVSPSSGTGSAKITLLVTENNTAESRYAELDFLSEDIKKKISLQQFAEKDYLIIPGLPIFRTSRLSVRGFTDYYVDHTDLFINSFINEKAYLGNLFSHSSTSHTNINELKGYTFNPITISTEAPVQGEIAKTYLPSLAEQNAFAKTIMDQKPSQIRSFISDMEGTGFYTLAQLHAIGMVNMGLKLDEIVAGDSYRNTTMNRNFGVVFSFRTSLFDLTMDLTDELVKEAIKPDDLARGVSYVSSVEYGRLGLLIIESDYRVKYVRPVINKILKDEALTAADLQILDASDFTHISFDNENKVQATKGKREIIEAYKAKITNKEDDNWYPISFQAFDIKETASTTFSFSYKL